MNLELYRIILNFCTNTLNYSKLKNLTEYWVLWKLIGIYHEFAWKLLYTCDILINIFVEYNIYFVLFVRARPIQPLERQIEWLFRGRGGVFGEKLLSCGMKPNFWNRIFHYKR